MLPRDAVLDAQPQTVQYLQHKLHYVICTMKPRKKWFLNILGGFDEGKSIGALGIAWNLVKHLSGKTSKTVLIQGEDHLDSWKTHFQKLLSSHNTSLPNNPIDPIFEVNSNIAAGIFSSAELDTAMKQMKLGKAPGLDGIPIKSWQFLKLRKILLKFCNKTYLARKVPSRIGEGRYCT